MGNKRVYRRFISRGRKIVNVRFGSAVFYHRNGFDEIFSGNGNGTVRRFIFARSYIVRKNGFYYLAFVNFVGNLSVRKSARFPPVFTHEPITKSVNCKHFGVKISAVFHYVLAEFFGGFNREGEA